MTAFRKRNSLALLLVFTLLVYVAGIASASLVGSVIKIGGIGLLVSRFGGQINDAFNKIANLKESDTVKTKVVPVLSVGQGTSIGAVQVTGTPTQVDKTEAVIQIEGKVLGLRIRALIPNDSKNITSIHRVEGVGVSGIVDVKV